MTVDLLPKEIRQVLRNEGPHIPERSLRDAISKLNQAERQKVCDWAQSHLAILTDTSNHKVECLKKLLTEAKVISVEERYPENINIAAEPGAVVTIVKEIVQWFYPSQKNEIGVQDIVDQFRNGLIDYDSAVRKLSEVDPDTASNYVEALQLPDDEKQTTVSSSTGSSNTPAVKPSGDRRITTASSSTGSSSIFAIQPSDAQRITGVSSGASPLDTLISFDTKYENLTAVAKKMTSRFPPTIPEITFTDTEKEQIGEAQEKIKKLEAHLTEKYFNDLDTVNWHGRLSHQRILWQDEKFIDAIQDPVVIKVILDNALNRREGRLPGGNTVSSLMLFGLGSNRPSYLISAAPNWYNKPPGGDWSQLGDMSISQSNPENPRTLSPAHLERIGKGLEGLSQVLAPSNSSVGQADNINTKIANASVDQLLKAFNALINTDDKIQQLTYSAAGASTRPNRMAGQCFEVMCGYVKLWENNEKNHAKVLGYGIISHALDAKHLAAAMYVMNNPSSTYCRQVGSSLDKGKETLNYFLTSAVDGDLGSEATDLLKIRLQQLMTIILDNNELRITPKMLERYL